MIQDPPHNQEIPFLAGTFTTILCIIFGANAVAIKMSLFGFGTFTTAGLRFSLAAIAILLWATVTRRSLFIKKGQAHQLLIISIFFTMQLALLYLGISKTSASRGTLVVNLQPFFVLLLAHYFIPGDRISWKKILGLLMGFSGMILVFFGKKGGTTDVQVGDLLILVAAFLWACNTVYTKRVINAFLPFQVVLYPMMFSIPFFFLSGYLWDASMIAGVDAEVLAALLYQGLVTGSFGFVAWNGMLKRYGAVSLHSFIFIMPIAGVLLGGLVLGEPITFDLLLALAFIASGIVVVNLKTTKYLPLFPTRGV